MFNNFGVLTHSPVALLKRQRSKYFFQIAFSSWGIMLSDCELANLIRKFLSPLLNSSELELKMAKFRLKLLPKNIEALLFNTVAWRPKYINPDINPAQNNAS